MTEQLLFRGGCVLTLGPKTANFVRGDVLVEGDRIAEVGTDLRARGATIIDASDTVVMPGFVDAHRHLGKTLHRGAAQADVSHLTPDDVYAATFLGLVSAIELGISTVVDWADLPTGDDAHVTAALQAHEDAGLRTVLVHRDAEPPDRADGPLTTHAYASPDLLETDGATITNAWSAARGHGMRIHAHARAAGTVRAMLDRDDLGDDVTLVHCTELEPAELDAVAAAGASVVLAPANEMARGAGAPPIQALIDRGIRPGLGIGDELLAPGDVFAQMRAVQSIQHAMMFDQKLAGKAGLPNLLSTREVIRYATLDGARAVGLAEITGSIEPGKQADLVLLRTDMPNIAPVNDPIGAVVWGMDPSNVDSVYVAGRPLMRAGRLEVDGQRARRLALAAWERVSGTGHLIDAGGSG